MGWWKCIVFVHPCSADSFLTKGSAVKLVETPDIQHGFVRAELAGSVSLKKQDCLGVTSWVSAFLRCLEKVLVVCMAENQASDVVGVDVAVKTSRKIPCR